MSSGTSSSSRFPSPTGPPASVAPPSFSAATPTNRERPDLIILAITSQARPQAALAEVAVAKWKEAGLLKPSVLKPVVATLERGLVLRKLGRLEDEDRKALRKVLGEILGS